MIRFGSQIWQETDVNISAWKGILSLTQLRTCIVHSVGKILIIFQQASHVRYQMNTEYGWTSTKGAQSSLYFVLCSRLFVGLQSAMTSLYKYFLIPSWRAVEAASH